MDQHIKERKSFFDRLKYADDFRIESETDSKGRTKEKAVYIGNWYVFRDFCSSDRWKMIITLVAGVAVMIFQFLQVLQTHVGSGSLFVLLPMAAALFPGLYLLMGAAGLPYKGNPMRRDQYMHSVIRVSRSAVAILSCNTVAFAATFVLRIVTGDWMFLSGDFIYLALFIVSTAFCAGMILLLRSLDITERPNSQISK